MNRVLIASALLLIAGNSVFAQPATDTPSKTANPGNANGVMTPAQQAEAEKQIPKMLAEAQQMRAAMSAMTPEQDQEAMRQREEPLLRQRLIQVGFKDRALQDAIVDFVAQQEKSRATVRACDARVYLSLRSRDPQEISGALADYLKAVDEVKAERETATKELDGEIEFSSNPRLTAFLSLYGLVGDASWFTSNLYDVGSPSGVAPFVHAARAKANAATGATPQAIVPAPPQTPAQKAESEKQYRDAFHAGQKMATEMVQMTPRQFQESMRKTHEVLLRREFAGAGFKDGATQDAIIAFWTEQEQSREEVRVAAGRVYEALTPHAVPTSQTEMKHRLSDYLNAVARARAERETATGALDGQIAFTANPRLKTLLTVKGLIGDASWFTGYVLPTGSQSLNALPVAL